jgi:hypothetical protein
VDVPRVMTSVVVSVKFRVLEMFTGFYRWVPFRFTRSHRAR